MRASTSFSAALLACWFATHSVLQAVVPCAALAQSTPTKPTPSPADDSPVESPGEEPTVDPVELAREAFRAGVQAAKASDWAAAEEEFLRSYELHPHPATLLNLATVQAQTSRIADAVHTYKRYLRDTRDMAEDDPQRSDARRAMKALAARVPAATIRVKGRNPRRATVVLDARDLSAEDLREALDVNPGEHEIIVREGELVVKRQAFVIAEGERLEIAVDLDEDLAASTDSAAGSGPRIGAHDALVGGPTPPPPPVAASDATLWEEPWFWVGAGAAAAAIVGVVLVVSLGGSREATQGNVTPAGRLP
jgi:hypothetical protein